MEVMSLNIVPIKYVRLGKVSEKYGPLKLSLQDPNDVFFYSAFSIYKQ